MYDRNKTARVLRITIACLAIVLVLLASLTIAMELGVFENKEPSATNPTGSSTPGTIGTSPSTTAPTAPTKQPTAPTEPTTVPTEPTTVPTEPPTVPTEPTEPPTEPPVFKTGTATIVNGGDLLMNGPVIRSAVINADGTYDFDRIFTHVKKYVTAADYAVANLETTLGGTKYAYAGYPRYNCPDGIAVSLQKAGFDMLLTANNHTFDTNSTGFFRTQQVLDSLGMAHLGTVQTADENLWQIHDINGIQVGMLCYTYETDPSRDAVALNGIPISKEIAQYIGTFHSIWGSHDLEPFYEKMEQHIADMKNAGAEAIVLYLHWGYEYQINHSSVQTQIAQKLCDLGADVIVGGHPHVIQPMDLLTSTVDPDHKTVCLYSTGNLISNQRVEEMSMKTGHTEDGILFSFTFAEYSDGTVILESAEVLPTWLILYKDSTTSKNVYQIIPLDKKIADWKSAFSLPDKYYQDTLDSYERTMDIVGAGLKKVNTYLAQLVEETEKKLGMN